MTPSQLGQRTRVVRAAGSVGELTTDTHWMRTLLAYGGPPSAFFIAEIWWPISDPQPGKAGR